MQEIIFLEPVFKQMVWGGNRLAKEYGYEVPGEKTGECWAVSAHPNGDCKISKGPGAGGTLSELWNTNRKYFGDLKGDMFPLLVKIIDAGDDLSIQVHPDDTYAAENANGSLGKTECWYILDCEEDAKIVIGHNAKDKKELEQLIDENRWNELIRVQTVNKGDFFQIEPGTVHAIKKGTLILETQQNSDITYRLYDYGRLQNGVPRELHIEESIQVIECPSKESEISKTIEEYDQANVEELVTCPYYQVKKITLNGKQDFIQDAPFLIMSVLEGSGEIDGNKINKGDHFILPSCYGTYCLSGKMMLISSSAVH